MQSHVPAILILGKLKLLVQGQPGLWNQTYFSKPKLIKLKGKDSQHWRGLQTEFQASQGYKVRSWKGGWGRGKGRRRRGGGVKEGGGGRRGRRGGGRKMQIQNGRRLLYSVSSYGVCDLITGTLNISQCCWYNDKEVASRQCRRQSWRRLHFTPQEVLLKACDMSTQQTGKTTTTKCWQGQEEHLHPSAGAEGPQRRTHASTWPLHRGHCGNGNSEGCQVHTNSVAGSEPTHTLGFPFKNPRSTCGCIRIRSDRLRTQQCQEGIRGHSLSPARALLLTRCWSRKLTVLQALYSGPSPPIPTTHKQPRRTEYYWGSVLLFTDSQMALDLCLPSNQGYSMDINC